MNDFFDKKVENTLSVIGGQIYKPLISGGEWYYGECDYKGKEYLPKADSYELRNMPIECSGYDKHFIIQKTVEIPCAQNNNETVIKITTGREGEWDALNPQFILYVDGKMIQGIDINHTESVISSGTHEILLYGYTGAKKDGRAFPLQVEICEINKLTEKAWYDIKVAFECFQILDAQSAEKANLYRNLEYALNIIDLSLPGSEEFCNSLKKASEHIAANIYCGTKSNVEIYEVGHTHIDVAWLWSLAQTEEKAQRSFSTVTTLMEQYPEYIFMSSQPQLYKFVKNAAPDIYEKIKKYIKDGRWEPEGAMWLEADCNITSGESLIRQIMHGKDFFKNEFGVDSHILWLPDVFGYSAATPQILKKCGVDTFVTNKLSWNETNKMPYDVFMWEGIDGTGVFTYFMTARDNRASYYEHKYETNYNGNTSPFMAVGSWERFQQKEYSNKAFVTYGYGDGGGGPTKTHLEYAKRLSKGVDGIPQFKFSSAGNFIKNLKEDFFKNSDMLKVMPKWVGELYLEMHRGTYTSIAKIKKQMRKSELQFLRSEALSSAAEVLLGSEYPKKEIYDNWETICLNQFHDILPGSSIFEVYEDSDKQLSGVLEVGKKIEEEKITAVANNIDSRAGVIVFNPTSFEADNVAEIDGKKFIAKNIPAHGWSVVKNVETTNNVILGDGYVENAFYILKFDADGNICSLFDKKQKKEYVQNGEAINKLEISEDYPKSYDAWEITDYYKQKTAPIKSVEKFEPIENEIAKGFKITRKYLNSTIVQKIWLYADDIGRIDIENEIDWKENHKLLKAVFPVDIHASEATYEIQFGNVKRPTHSNTSWDAAKFEVCAHKYADISDNGSGFAVMNDCKYGYSAAGNTISLTLLKCAEYPNPAADKHYHTFTYSLYPHCGSFANSDVIKQAYLLNMPFSVAKANGNTSNIAEKYSFVSSSSDDIVIETIKKAEKSDNIVVRMYESTDRTSNTTLKFGFNIEKAYITDMLENIISELKVENNCVDLCVKNFEITTVMVKPSKK